DDRRVVRSLRVLDDEAVDGLRLAPVAGDDLIWQILGEQFGPVAASHRRQHFHRLIAVVVRVLHHGSLDLAGGDRLERYRVFVEADDLHLADQRIGFYRREDGRRVISVKADHANIGDASETAEHRARKLLRILFGAAIGLGFAIDEEVFAIHFARDFLAVEGAGGRGSVRFRRGQFFQHASNAALAVRGNVAADEHGDHAAVWQRLLHHSPGGAARFLVVHADVTEPPGVVGIVVHCDQRNFLADPLQRFLLPRRVDDADGDSLHALLHESFDDRHLLGDIEPFRLAEQYVDIEIVAGLIRASLAQIPERIGAVGDDADFDAAGLVGAAAARGNRGEDSRDGEEEADTEQSRHGAPAFENER